MTQVFPSSKQMSLVMGGILTLGVITFAALVIVSLAGIAVALVYVLSLVMAVLHSLSVDITTLYAQSDPALKLLMLILAGWGVSRVGRRFFRK